MKKILCGLMAAVLSVGALCGCGKSDGRTVTVQSVAAICNLGPIGVSGCFGGVIVSGEKEEVKRDNTKKVLEVLVEEGQDVKAGDVLFTYDTQAMEFSLSKLYLDLETAKNTITYSNRQLDVLRQQITWASNNDRANYELQIATLEANVKEAEYNISLRERDIAAMEKTMSITDVKAGISGRVTKAGQADSTVSDSSGSTAAASTSTSTGTEGSSSDGGFITITDMTNFRVEGQINELNTGILSVGMPVIIRSRVDNTQTWSGTLKSIDWEHPVTSSNSMYGSSDSSSSSTKYPFYITLNSLDGLILGQHVYIEPDQSMGTGADGIQLPAYYLFNINDSTASVWAENSNGKLEQRNVTLGEADEDGGTIAVLSGLSASDYIAFPEDGLSAGLSTAHYEASEDLANDSDFLFDDSDAAGLFEEETEAQS